MQNSRNEGAFLTAPMPDGVRVYVEGEFRGQFKCYKQKETCNYSQISTNVYNMRIYTPCTYELYCI